MRSEETVHGFTGKGIFGEYHAKVGTFGSYCSLDEIQGQIYDYVRELCEFIAAESP